MRVREFALLAASAVALECPGHTHRRSHRQVLWRVNAGGEVAMGPMTYAVKGKQYVAFAAGSSLFVYALN
jgi:hypothetical protein